MDITEFEKQIAACHNALMRFVYYKTPNKADGDDVLQDTMLAAFKHRDEVKNANGFKAWVLAIAANKCKDFYRSRVKLPHLSIDEVSEATLVSSRYGHIESNRVHETLEQLGASDAQILELYFLQGYSQDEISKKLEIPVGTVKSRLHIAKKRFSVIYPFPPKGEQIMKKLPMTMPAYTITRSEEKPFDVKWEELAFWFIIPRLGEQTVFGFYDLPDRKYTGAYSLKVTGVARVHDVLGVEIEAQYCEAGKSKPSDKDKQIFVAQLTDTHCRWLSESHYEGDVKRYSTFLDADEFLSNWGFGEDNCGLETNLKQKGIIKKKGNIINAELKPFLLDIVDRCSIAINGKTYDCVCVLDIGNSKKGIVVEHFIDKNGRAVLERRYNSDTWRIEQYKMRWSEKLPTSEQLIINGEVFVCWYECISDYVL